MEATLCTPKVLHCNLLEVQWIRVSRLSRICNDPTRNQIAILTAIKLVVNWIDYCLVLLMMLVLNVHPWLKASCSHSLKYILESLGWLTTDLKVHALLLWTDHKVLLNR